MFGQSIEESALLSFILKPVHCAHKRDNPLGDLVVVFGDVHAKLLWKRTGNMHRGDKCPNSPPQNRCPDSPPVPIDLLDTIAKLQMLP